MHTKEFYKYNFDEACPDFVGLSEDKTAFASDHGAYRKLWKFDKAVKTFKEFVNLVGLEEYTKFKEFSEKEALMGLIDWYFTGGELFCEQYQTRAKTRVVHLLFKREGK